MTPYVTKGTVLGIPLVMATYTPIVPGHWSIQGVDGCSRQQTQIELSNYAKQSKPVTINPKFHDIQQVDAPQ